MSNVFKRNVLRLILLFIATFLGCLLYRSNFCKSEQLTERNRFWSFKHIPYRGLSSTSQHLTNPLKSRNQCHDVLNNLTNGEWILTSPNDVKYYDDVLHSYWLRKKILRKTWRDDGKCGNKNLLPKVEGSKWPGVPALCDPYGQTPCCNNLNNGICSSPDKSTCECKNCLDLRKYLHAETAQWKTKDSNCLWKNYRGKDGCDVIEQSKFQHLHFIGDSFVRNMFVTLLMLLSNDTERGAWSTTMKEEWKEYCKNEKFFLYDECRQIIRDSNKLLYPEKLCNGAKANFTMSAKIAYGPTIGDTFVETSKSLIKRTGNLILFGVGVHNNLNPDIVLNQYLDSFLRARNEFYEKSEHSSVSMWPRIIFVLPMPPGLLKPSRYLPLQSNTRVSKFANKMKSYCQSKNIPVLDFRPLAVNVHSFDGQHYGLSVNLMKNQVFLNFLSSLNESNF